MSLLTRLQQDLNAAVRAKDAFRRDALRLVIDALQKEAKARGGALDEAAEVKVLRSEVKKRLESAEQFARGGRQAEADGHRAEAELIEAYLPRQLDEEATRAAVAAAIAATGASGVRDVGRVIKAVMAEHGGVADGRLVQRFAKELLEAAAGESGE